MRTEPKASREGAGNDNQHGAANGPGGLLSDVIMAVRFYCLLPTGASPHEKPSLNRIARALPLASVIIGIVPALVLLLGWLIKLPDAYTALLAVGASALVTGAMAEDAIGDSADGLGGRTPERRLEIFRDSRIGAYGVIAIVVFIGLRTIALTQFLDRDGLGAIGLFVGAGVLSRSGALWLSVALPPARSDGASAGAGRLGRNSFLIGGAFALLTGFILAAPFAGYAGYGLALVLMAGCAFGWTLVWGKLAGGQTGDLIGGLQAVLEIAALTAFIVL